MHCLSTLYHTCFAFKAAKNYAKCLTAPHLFKFPSEIFCVTKCHHANTIRAIYNTHIFTGPHFRRVKMKKIAEQNKRSLNILSFCKLTLYCLATYPVAQPTTHPLIPLYIISVQTHWPHQNPSNVNELAFSENVSHLYKTTHIKQLQMPHFHLFIRLPKKCSRVVWETFKRKVVMFYVVRVPLTNNDKKREEEN